MAAAVVTHPSTHTLPQPSHYRSQPLCHQPCRDNEASAHSLCADLTILASCDGVGSSVYWVRRSWARLRTSGLVALSVSLRGKGG